MKNVLIRDVTQKECFWLYRDFKKGEFVYEFHGTTYGCISPKGKAFSEEDGENPFFELPKDSVKQLPVDDGHIFPTEEDIYLK